MTKLEIHRGVLLSLMWSLSEELYKMSGHKSVLKLRKTVMHRIKFISNSDLDIIEELKVKAWAAVSGVLHGEVNLPILIDSIYWEYTPYFGKNIKHLLEQIVDDLLPENQPFRLSFDVVEAYKDQLDKVIFDYLKEVKRDAELRKVL